MNDLIEDFKNSDLYNEISKDFSKNKEFLLKVEDEIKKEFSEDLKNRQIDEIVKLKIENLKIANENKNKWGENHLKKYNKLIKYLNLKSGGFKFKEEESKGNLPKKKIHKDKLLHEKLLIDASEGCRAFLKIFLCAKETFKIEYFCELTKEKRIVKVNNMNDLSGEIGKLLIILDNPNFSEDSLHISMEIKKQIENKIKKKSISRQDAMKKAAEMAGLDEDAKNNLMIFSRDGQAKNFISKNPVYYDKTGFWWFWNFEKSKYERTDEIDILNSINKILGIETIKSNDRTEILNALKQEGRKNQPEDAKKTWIQFKDKIVDIETGEEFEATPKYFITNPLPYKIGDTEETPILDKLFKEWVVMDGLQDESYIKTLYEIISYSALSHQFLQRLFAFVGSGSNGKGVYLSIIDKFLGEENTCTSELKILGNNNFEASALYKKQACFFGEVDIYDMQNTNLIKKLSGEDKIRYEFKGKNTFSESSSTTCLMNTNSLPITPDKSKGFYRRWLIVDFPHEFKTGEDILSKIPEKEFENLSRKVIKICKELYQKKCFTNEGNIDDRIKKYEDRSNPLLKFISECCDEDFESYIKLVDFYKYLKSFLKKHRLRPIQLSRIKNQLKSEGYEIVRKNYKIDEEIVKIDSIFGLKVNLDKMDKMDNKSELDLHMTNQLENAVQTVHFVQKAQNDSDKPIDFEDSGIKEVLNNE